MNLPCVFIANEIVKRTLARGRVSFNGNRRVLAILGFAFKENVSGVRNTRVIDMMCAFQSHRFEVQVQDPLAYPKEAEHEHGIQCCRSYRLYRRIKRGPLDTGGPQWQNKHLLIFAAKDYALCGSGCPSAAARKPSLSSRS